MFKKLHAVLISRLLLHESVHKFPNFEEKHIFPNLKKILKIIERDNEKQEKLN